MKHQKLRQLFLVTFLISEKKNTPTQKLIYVDP